ncbi:MAG: hypothetical protein Kow00124_00410 [Anaerolineae bacterium]
MTDPPSLRYVTEHAGARAFSSDLLLAAGLAALAFLACAAMALLVTERIPHLEDEAAYLYQARVFARGALWGPPAPDERLFSTPFVLTIEGRRVGKYSIGWPLLLSLGERLGAGWLLNPLLGAISVALIYALARDLYDRRTAITAAILAGSSPLFLIQSSTFMSHAAAALWMALYLWAVLRAARAGRTAGRAAVRSWALIAGIALGMLALTRPFTALAAAIPSVALFAVTLLRVRRGMEALAPHNLLAAYWPLPAAALIIAALQPAYLWAVTGSPTTNLYTLIWPYDRLGFGPGIGPYGGHTLGQALRNAYADLYLWSADLFGWPRVSWVPILAGVMLAACRPDRERRLWAGLLAAPFAVLVLLHLAYWVGAQVYGPRYYYEAHAGLAVLAAVGLNGAATWIASRLRSRPAFVLVALLAAGLAVNLFAYLPQRLEQWHDLYGITRTPVDDLEALRGDDPALVLVRGSRWVEYAALFSLNSPWYDGPVVVAHDVTPDLSAAAARAFQGRQVWYYRDGEFSAHPSRYTD